MVFDSSSRFPNQRWQIAPSQPDQAARLAHLTQLPLLLAQVLLNRGMDTPEAAQTFLDPEGQVLPSPLEEFPDLAIALELLLNAIVSHEAIAICGDYDADGMTSTALLIRALRFLGAQVDYAIPSRMQEGYGINRRIVEDFYEDGIRVILTVDNGIAAYDPIAHARELGLTVIITDHHDLPPTLPPANAILNPKLLPENSLYRGLAGVGVAYVLAICLAQSLQKTQDLTTPLIELFTLGTIADLAPLTGVNRRWVRRGLKLLPKSRIPGVQALIQLAGVEGEKNLKPEAIGFRLGPRINAIGRISDPQIVIELLTTDHEGRALELAMKCEQVNRIRQQLCELIEQDAIVWCEMNQLDLQQLRVLVVVQPNWHHGVIGIVASRLVERYGVPVFIGTYEEEGTPMIRGSARGIPEFDVFAALQFCGDLLEKFGGHRAAGGFTLSVDYLEEFQARLSHFARQQLQPEHLKPLIKIDAEANLADLTLDLYQQIDRLHPCGIENPDPVFWTAGVRIVDQQVIGRDRAHLKLTLTQSTHPTIKAIAWRWGEYCPLTSPIDIAYRLRLNEWNGQQSVELELVGARPAQGQGNRGETIVSSRLPMRQTTQAQLDLSSPSSHSTIPLEIQSEDQQITDSSDDCSRNSSSNSSGNCIEFYYNKRQYTCYVASTGETKELRIRNAEGQVLAIQPKERRGLLGRRRETAKEVDVSQPYYFNLIRAALDAIEISVQGKLVQQKEWLIAAQEKKIAKLNQQLAELNQEQINLSPVSPTVNAPTVLEPVEIDAAVELSMSQSLDSGCLGMSEQAELGDRIEPSQAETQPPEIPKPAAVKAETIRQRIKAQLGDKIWFCLSQQSQKDLVAADKQRVAIASLQETPPDYSKPALKLAQVVEREIVQVFFKEIYQFLLKMGEPNEIGGVTLTARKKYTLELLPALLTSQWQSFDEELLQQNQPVLSQELYCLFAPNRFNPADQQTVQTFLRWWDHPLAQWLRDRETAAGAIDQVSQLRELANRSDYLLQSWQFELLQTLVLGNETQPGIFQSVYSVT